jgi:hypothetical protein
MRFVRVAAILVGIALVGELTVLLAAGQPKQVKTDIWKDEAKEAQPPWWQRDLTNDVIDKVMAGLQKRDPATARRLTELRKKDLERFKAELREQGRPELDQITRERYESRRQERTAKFLEWLKAHYPKDEQALAKLKDGDPQLYARNLDRLSNQYGYIFEADSSNPELGAVLKEDFELKRRSDELCKRIRTEKSDAKKQAIGAELQEVIAKRYDLIVRRKEIAYEQLLKRLNDLEKQVRESKAEADTWRDPKIKQENVKQRVQALTDDKVRFKWD